MDEGLFQLQARIGQQMILFHKYFFIFATKRDKNLKIRCSRPTKVFEIFAKVLSSKLYSWQRCKSCWKNGLGIAP